MELKDVILSTLAEMEDTPSAQSADFEIKEKIELVTEKSEIKPLIEELQESNVDNEMIFLSSIRERLLVLFEGFQAPNNSNIEAKVDMTLNFLEYVLATVDNRIDILNKGN